MTGIEYIKKSVSELLGHDLSGHDNSHVLRVYNMAMDFCNEISEADRNLVVAAMRWCRPKRLNAAGSIITTLPSRQLERVTAFAK